MKCIYKIIDIRSDLIKVDYYPPSETGLPFTRVRLPFHVDADTTAADVAARVESSIPIEEWEVALDKVARPESDLSAMIDVGVEVDVGVIAARSRSQRAADQEAARLASEEEAAANSGPDNNRPVPAEEIEV